MGLDSFSKILQKLIGKNPQIAQGLQIAATLDHWAKAVGPVIAKNTRAVKIQNKTLMIEVSHGVWKQELSLRKRELIKRVNLEIEKAKHGEKIEDLFFLDNPGLKRQ